MIVLWGGICAFGWSDYWGKKHKTIDWNKYWWSILKTLRNSFITFMIIQGFNPVLTVHDPPYIEWFVRVPAALVVYDGLFYYTHRLFHTPVLYWIHSDHHAYTQTVVAPNALDAAWIEHVLLDLLPMIVASVACGFGFYMNVLWVALATFNVLYAHSGYSANMHHLKHHQTRTCNYGANILFDYLHGTRR